MLLQSYVRAMLLVHGAVAFSYKNDARLDKHVLRSGREYSSQIEVSAASGQANNDLALMMGRQNNNDTATTRNQADSNAANDTAELDPRDRRPAELEASEIEFRTYLCWDDTEGCPAGLPECQDCGGLMLLWHRDVLNPSPRCSGLEDEDMKWKDCRCEDHELPEMHQNPSMPLPDPDESEPDL